MDLESLGLASQVLAAILSLIFIKKNKSSFYKLLCVFLVIVVVTEVIGACQIRLGVKSSGITHYISALFQFSIIALMYYQILKDKRWKKLIVVTSILFFVYWVWGFSNTRTYFSQIVIFGCLNSSIVAFLYLRKLLVSNKIINYKEHLPFWISVGFLIFYLPTIPFFAMQSYMNNRDLFYIIHTLIILMNLVIITGLIWSGKKEM